MTVYAVVCSDPVDGNCWVHGLYTSRATAENVYARLTKDTYDNVRLEKKPVIDRREPR